MFVPMADQWVGYNYKISLKYVHVFIVINNL